MAKSKKGETRFSPAFMISSAHAGRYMATRSLFDNTVVAEGANPKKVFDEAVRKGYPFPVVVFCPNEKQSVII